MKILITGCAGFIGFHTSLALLKDGVQVYGMDNLNHYYSPALKLHRLEQLKQFTAFKFFQADTEDINYILKPNDGITAIIHLAAQSGVRYVVENKNAHREYLRCNLQSLFQIMEFADVAEVEHLIYASSSSVYGDGDRIPKSFYAATKLSAETLLKPYAKDKQLPVTILRFFTVYGPYGRPDMALSKFIKCIYHGQEITLYKSDKDDFPSRDFTYIDDCVGAITSIVNAKTPRQDNDWCAVFDVGAGRPISLDHAVETIEHLLARKSIYVVTQIPDSDILCSNANPKPLYTHSGWRAKTGFIQGMEKTVSWMLENLQFFAD